MYICATTLILSHVALYISIYLKACMFLSNNIGPHTISIYPLPSLSAIESLSIRRCIYLETAKICNNIIQSWLIFLDNILTELIHVVLIKDSCVKVYAKSLQINLSISFHKQVWFCQTAWTKAPLRSTHSYSKCHQAIHESIYQFSTIVYVQKHPVNVWCMVRVEQLYE